MSLRPKTIRRLIILLSAVAAIVAVGAALYTRNENKRQARLLQERDIGIDAFHAGDYPLAMARLGPYLSRVSDDADALYVYGASRLRVEQPDRRHIREAKSALERALQRDPDNIKIRHTLLDLYTRAGGYHTEAVELADKILADDPNDIKALRGKAIAMDRQHRYKEALDISRRINELLPTDLEQQLVTYDLMRKLKFSPSDLLARAREQQQRHPDDPRFEMLLAMAYGHIGEFEQGTRWLTQAASRPAPDAPFVRQMIRLLDSLQSYQQSLELLERSYQQSKDVEVLRLLVQRLWQNRDPDRVLGELDQADEKAAGDTTLLAFRALALHDLHKRDQAKELAGILAQRATDMRAVAWSSALTVLMAPASDLRESLAELKLASARAPDNPVVRWMLGNTYARLGETELAINAWRGAIELSPAWAAPRIETARALAASGRFDEAVHEAQLAVRCAPDQVHPAAVLAAVRFEQLERSPDAPASQRLLEFVTKIRQTAPGEPISLPVYVTLLARANQRQQATDALHAALARAGEYDPAALLRLASISRAHQLGLENRLLDSVGEDSPNAAIARASMLAADGRAEEGLELLRSHAGPSPSLPWKLALAQYRESIDDPDARAAWVALGDAHAEDVAVQSAILTLGASARSDREFIARTIERLRELTGPEGLAWRIERARWLIAGEAREKDSAEAVNLLNEVIRIAPRQLESHLLLALAYENVNNLPGAAKALQSAVELEPSSAPVTLRLVRMLQLQSKFAEARVHLNRIASMDNLSPEHRHRIAAALAQQGDFAAAVKVLETKRDALDRPSRLLLAELYHRVGRAGDAEATYGALLSHPPIDPATWQSAVAFYARQRNVARGQLLLSRLQELSLAPVEEQLLRARFHELFRNEQLALEHLSKATQIQPSSSQAWRELITTHLRARRFEAARQSADEAKKHLPDDRAIQSLWSIASAFSQQQPLDVSPLLEAFCGDPQHPAVTDLLSALGDARAKNLSSEQALAAVRPVIDRHPRQLALQLALMNWQVRAGRIDEAQKTAASLISAFPASAEAARSATQIYRLAGRHDLMAAAAQKWRERSLDDPREADIALAQAWLATGDASAALKHLAPYLTDAPDGENDLAMLSVATRAMALVDRAGDAWTLLESHLAQSRDHRRLWMAIASADIPQLQAASNWLFHVASFIASDATDEQVMLASAWYTLGRRFQSDEAQEAARRILQPLSNRADAPASALSLYATLASQRGDLDVAEDFYRRSLTLAPDQPPVLNNLAYLLLERGGDLNQARELARRAAALAPQNAEFHDTLARIDLRLGDAEAAMQSFQRALRADPQNLAALIGLASLYSSGGRHDAAVPLLQQIETLLKTTSHLPDALREELESIRATVKASL